MEEVDRESAVSYTAMEKYMDDFDKAKGVLEESKKEILNGLKYMGEEQGAFAAKNGVPNADGLEILDINAGGKITSVTRDTLNQMKGTRLEALFSSK